MLKKYQSLFSICLVVMLFIIVGAAGCTPQEPAVQEPGGNGDEQQPVQQTEEKVVLKAVSFLEQTTREGQWFMKVIDAIHEEMGDKIEIDYLGGPDVIPGYEQVEALDKNTVDFIQMSFAWLQDRYPEAELAAVIADLSPAEQRSRGLNDFLNEGITASNTDAYFLGMCGLGYPITFYTTFEVSKIEDLKGKQARISPLHQIAAESLGMETMTTSPTEMYSSVERKIVDGYFWPAYISDYGLEEVTTCRLYPAFGGSDASLLINKTVWNSMSKELQEELQKTIDKALDNYYNIDVAEEVAKEEALLEANGIKTVVLPDDYREIQIDGYRQKAIQDLGARGEEFFDRFVK
ncbi:MAG TPA: hypothetical protein GXZ24_09635 [Firmicutes bacterium]|nr:hypothetical protein [Bacillota bacterium]